MNKKIALILATLVGTTMLTASVFAWGGWGGRMGYGMGIGRGFGSMLTDEERSKLQSMSPEERFKYIQKLREEKALNQNSNSYVGFGRWFGRGFGGGFGMRLGGGLGRMLTFEERIKLYNMSPEERFKYIQKLRKEKGFPAPWCPFINYSNKQKKDQ